MQIAKLRLSAELMKAYTYFMMRELSNESLVVFNVLSSRDYTP